MLSDEERNALQEFYKGKELYDPSKDAAQQPADFTPQMCHGGGMAKGGMVMEDIPSAVPSFDMDASGSMTVRDGLPAMSSPSGASIPQMEIPQTVPIPMKRTEMSRAVEPVAESAKITPEQMSALRAHFDAMSERADKYSPEAQAAAAEKVRRANRLVNMTAKPVATFADAIMQGVARAGNPGFSRAISEGNQADLENTIAQGRNLSEQAQQANAAARRQALENPESALAQAQMSALTPMLLKAGVPKESLPYMTPDIAQGLLSGAISLKEAEAKIAQSQQELFMQMGARKSEEQLRREIEAAKLPATGILHPTTWGRGTQIEEARRRLLGGESASTSSEIKTATNPKTGHQIISTDGGKTWREK